MPPIPQSRSQHEDELEFRSVDDFVKGDSLGSGSFCDVVCCTDNVSGKQYAMKIVPKTRAESDQACIMEAHCLRRLERSPLVINMYWDIDTPLQWVGILELCSDGDLWAKVRHCGCVAQGESAWYASQMVEALAVVHTAGIAHRDVKCENFLITPGLKLKLIDFGSARDTTHPEVSPMQLRPQYEHHVGTPNFMSPEAINGKANDRRSDLWSLGCCIYQLITGVPPFNAPTPFQIMQKALASDLLLPASGLSEPEKDLIRQLTQVMPDSRLGAQGAQTRKVLHHLLLRTPASRHPDDDTSLTTVLRQVGHAAIDETIALITAEAAAAAGEDGLALEGLQAPPFPLSTSAQRKPGAAVNRLLELLPFFGKPGTKQTVSDCAVEMPRDAVPQETPLPGVQSSQPLGDPGPLPESVVVQALTSIVREACAETTSNPQAFSTALADRIDQAHVIPEFVRARVHRFKEMAERRLIESREQAVDTQSDDQLANLRGTCGFEEEMSDGSALASPRSIAEFAEADVVQDLPSAASSPLSAQLGRSLVAEEALSRDGPMGDSQAEVGDEREATPSTATGGPSCEEQRPGDAAKRQTSPVADTSAARRWAEEMHGPHTSAEGVCIEQVTPSVAADVLDTEKDQSRRRRCCFTFRR